MAATCDRAEIMRGLQIYHRPGDTFEIRILDTRYKTISGYFNDCSNAADAAISYNGEYAIYATINPTNPRLIARANNKLKKYAKNTTSDADITRLNWLPADCDPPRPAGISSTDEEHDISIEKCKEIKQWLIDDLGWPEKAFVIVDSGNGGYLLARIELDNTKENSDLVAKCLETLDYLFTDKTFHVDTTSGNPARVLRVPGTLNAKGDEVGDMRHRMARILKAPESFEVVPRALLGALAAMLPKQEEAPRTYVNGQGFDPVAYCQAHNLQVHHTKTWTDPRGIKCSLAVLEQCVFNPDHYLSAVIIGWPNGAKSYRCRHYSCLKKHWPEAKAKIEPSKARQDNNRDPAADMDELFSTTSDDPTLTLEQLTKAKGKKTQIDPDTGERVLDEEKKPVLVPDRALSPEKAAIAILQSLNLVMSAESEEDVYYFNGQIYHPNGSRIIDKVLCNVAGDLVTTFNLKEVLRRIRNALLARPVIFEPDPYLLPVRNGVINLLTGEFRDYQPDDLILDQLPIIYDPEAQCSVYFAFMDSITPSASDRIMLTDWLAANAIKEPFAYVLFLLGLGRNGKGIYERLLKRFFGKHNFRDMNLAQVVKNDFAQSHFFRVRGWIASETGKRREKAVIGTDFVKMTSGSGTIDADRKNLSRIQFEPYFKTIVDTNDMPRIEDTSRGWIERFCKADLPYVFLPNPGPNNPLEKLADQLMFEKLTTESELSGILNLVIHRAKAIGKSRTIHKRPGSEMFKEYTEQSASVTTFLELFCEYENHLLPKIPTNIIYDAYIQWCQYKVGEIVDNAYFGRVLKRFCDNHEPERPTIDGKKVTTYPGLVFHKDRYDAAIEIFKNGLGVMDSHVWTSNGQVGRQVEKSKKIVNGQVGQVELWIELKEKFGKNSQNLLYMEESSKIPVLPVLPVQVLPSDLAVEKSTRDLPVLPENLPVPEKQSWELAVLVRFKTDYKIQLPAEDDPFKFVDCNLAEGDELVVHYDRARTWLQRGIATVQEIVLPWEEPAQEAEA